MWKTQHQDPALKQSAIVTTSLGSGHFTVTERWPKQFSSSFTISASSWHELLNEQEEVPCEQLRHLDLSEPQGLLRQSLLGFALFDRSLCEEPLAEIAEQALRRVCDHDETLTSFVCTMKPRILLHRSPTPLTAKTMDNIMYLASEALLSWHHRRRIRQSSRQPGIAAALSGSLCIPFCPHLPSAISSSRCRSS